MRQLGQGQLCYLFNVSKNISGYYCYSTARSENVTKTVIFSRDWLEVFVLYCDTKRFHSKIVTQNDRWEITVTQSAVSQFLVTQFSELWQEAFLRHLTLANVVTQNLWLLYFQRVNNVLCHNKFFKGFLSHNSFTLNNFRSHENVFLTVRFAFCDFDHVSGPSWSDWPWWQNSCKGADPTTKPTRSTTQQIAAVLQL